MKKELNKSYSYENEEAIYNRWIEKKYFHGIVDKNKKSFTIAMPPPNITGQLHMGHALNNTVQDVLIRAKRMQGYSALWMPGTDHAAIATEIKIVEDMETEGLTKSDLGRDKFLERAWEWKDKYGGEITRQLRKIGCSCDWDRERFTMDEGLSSSVSHVFMKLYEKNLIYRGEKLINWCPNCQTTVSDAEVEHIDMPGKLYYLKYKIDETDDYLIFATTRPETMLGDTGIAVNPDDQRYKNIIGKTVTVPIVNRQIPIIADRYVDKEYGSGVVKITPAHDFNDNEVGERNNLDVINIFNDSGIINENGGSYEGLSIKEARKKIIEEFKTLGLYEKEEDINHSVGVHERCNEIIEPAMKLQWFVKMKDMGQKALDVYNNDELKFTPPHFGKIYVNWLENIHDWCISRQLWWGHRIPAYYCQDCNEFIVSIDTPEKCNHCGSSKFVQDEDTLDTWFSSALWPFSTLGWPEDTEEYNYFFPTDVLVTSYDIIFFWVVRMVFSSLEQTGKLPFTDVLINGLLRDSQGAKMSKSLGNGIDPLDIISEYGADALRLTLLTGNSPGNDMRFSYEKLESDRNFLNKLWNATRFVMMNFDDDNKMLEPNNLKIEDKWIISKINTLIKNVTENIDKFELGVALQNTYDFIWDEYCDWYIEMVKPRLYNKDDSTRNAALYTLKYVLIDGLKLLHPFLPFITEEIFKTIQDEEETIMLSPWPVYKEENNFPQEEKAIDAIKEGIKSIRNIRSKMNVHPARKSNVFIVTENQVLKDTFEKGKMFFKVLAHAEEVFVQNNNNGIENDAVSAVIKNAVIFLPFAELVDFEEERKRLGEEKEKLISEIERAEKKLSNKDFIEKAPEKIIREEKEKRENYKKMLEQVEKQLEKLKN